ncbi:Dot/Icm T4SS effector Wip [Legionella anisa]|uniref:Type IV secretion protein Dot n=1 Tax=Legionella anisa TaxID=28082 RepID=A0AAX0WTJ2_9GAMM|nr:Dot/Icm T4SS effector Wip [Legionella anisa]KTC76366.1 substrate of the Dot/Icm secretion system [Legionella anisa]PNL60511.1 type IV secretion protein Dot [Legionella anisa]UAK80723.1 type IV secretion protein Dot [Legionella anisa]
MTNHLISKNVDIYKYPSEFEHNLGSITLGDLHGNPIKLIHFLFRHQIIQFKDEVTHVEETYQQFVTLYEQYGEILQEYLENHTLLQFTQIKIDNAKERIANLDKQLLEANKETQQYQTLLQLRQQTLEKLQAVEEEQRKLKHKLSEPKNKLADCVAQFNHFMAQLRVCDNQTIVRLLGDEVADRGNSDYFTLRILNLLHRNHCPLTILVSNHGSEFIYAYEQLIAGHPFVPQGYIGDVQTPSFWGLKLLLDQEIVPHSELIHLVNERYKPTLKILDYTISEKGITLFSHAPIRFDAIELMAKSLGVNYDDSTSETLATTIDQINHQFQSYIENNTIHSLFHTDAIHDRTNMSEQERAAWPLIYLFWNRWDETKETETARPATHNGYTINYVHGHDGFQSTLAHIYNLDTLCGKEPRKTEDQHIEQAFRYLIENRNKIADKTPSEVYLRNVLRYKVLNSDEHCLEPNERKKQEPHIIPPNNELDGSIKKLSLLGRPIVHPATSLIELPTVKPSPRELIITTEKQEDLFFSSLNLIN